MNWTRIPHIPSMIITAATIPAATVNRNTLPQGLGDAHDPRLLQQYRRKADGRRAGRPRKPQMRFSVRV